MWTEQSKLYVGRWPMFMLSCISLSITATTYLKMQLDMEHLKQDHFRRQKRGSCMRKHEHITWYPDAGEYMHFKLHSKSCE